MGVSACLRRIRNLASASLRPKEFISDLHASLRRKRPKVIRQACEENPGVFLQLVAGLVRKEVEPDTAKYDDVTTEGLDRMVQALAASHG